MIAAAAHPRNRGTHSGAPRGGADDPPAPLTALGHSLATARGFTDVAIAVCRSASRFELRWCAVALHRAGDGPIFVVDNMPSEDYRYRLASVRASTAAAHPAYRSLRASPSAVLVEPRALAAFGYREELGYLLALPLIDLSGLIGSIHCGCTSPITEARERELVAMSTLVSVCLAKLGITAVTSSPTQPTLSPRQYEVVQLLARGARNLEIAQTLEISRNTVKKLLKEVFQRLGVRNRTEIAARFARIAAPLEIPSGVTRVSGVWVSRE